MSAIKKNYDENLPSNSPAVVGGSSSVFSLSELKQLQAIFSAVEANAAQIAEELFDYLFDVGDFDVINGEIPVPKSGPIRHYIMALNRLFRLARKKRKNGGFSIINRKLIKDTDKKTYTFCMCIDGGASLDILCEVVNQENNARTPTSSPVKITITQLAPNLTNEKE